MNRRVRLLFSIDFQWSICMHWTREGDDWILKHGRRKFGRVFRDSQYPGMWRSYRADRRLPDIANLSWAKNAVLIEAEGEQSRNRANPQKSPQKRANFKGL
jgi:hypothetical protein